MNIRNSGKIPEKLKKLAAVVSILSITLFAGCAGFTDSGGSTETSVGESVPSYTTEATSTHEPVVESSVPEVSSSVPVSSSTYSSSSSSSSSTTIGSTTSSEEKPPISSSTEEPSEPTPPPESSSPPPVSSSTVEEPEPPVVVTIPNFPVPTSPGINVATSSKGWIDYSNAEQGYISVQYTGSVQKIKLRILCGNETPYPHDVTPGVTEYFPLSFGAGNYTVQLLENTSGNSYAEVVSCSFSTNTSSLQPFTYSNNYSVYDSNSQCVYKAAELCAGKTGTIDKVAAIFEWVAGNISYDYNLAATVQSGYVPNPDRTYNNRTGICFDYASLMCAMLRSQGIPTRLVVGWASPEIYHAWNEVYTQETGWITPELMLKNAGWNIVDSTFYSSSANKSQIASYISSSSNYTVRYYY